jgi:hypothetical protein
MSIGVALFALVVGVMVGTRWGGRRTERMVRTTS